MPSEGEPRKPPMEETKITEPSPRAAIAGIAIWLSHRLERTLPFMIRS